MENLTRERLEESNRLKEKACEDCMRELEGFFLISRCSSSGKHFIRLLRGICFGRVFWSRSRDICLQEIKEPLENQAALVYNLIRK